MERIIFFIYPFYVDMFLSLPYDYTNEKAEGHETMSNHLRKITMATIQNDLITLRVNDAGQIEHLSMKDGPNVIARPTGLFRAILKTGENWEDVVFADRQWLNVSVSGHSVLISCDKLRTRDGEQYSGITPVRAMINEGAALIPTQRLALCCVVESGTGLLEAAAFGPARTRGRRRRRSRRRRT